VRVGVSTKVISGIRGGTVSSETPSVIEDETYISNDAKVLERTNIWSWVLTGSETKADRAAEDQQQITRPTDIGCPLPKLATTFFKCQLHYQRISC
jgi:hypothetical protein